MLNEITEILKQVFIKEGYNITPKITKSEIEGVDFQCNDLFKLAAINHTSPVEIGEKLEKEINSLDDFSKYFKKVSFSRPGFLNLTLSDEIICKYIKRLNDDEKLGLKESNQTIVLDYGGPNIAKPLHVGHLRTAIIGQAINNLLKFQGNKTISDVHLGDIGLQMGQVISGILNDFQNQTPEEIEFDLNYLNVTYPKISGLCKENEEVKEKCEQITKELQEGNKDYQILWKKICDVSIKDIKRIYKYLSVDFDLWYGESDAYKYFDELTDYLNKQNILKKDEGALVIDVKEDTDKNEMPPFIYKKSNGAYLYSSSDLATIYQRQKDYNPDEIIYVADSRQAMHFTQVFRAAKKSHIFEKELKHVGYGTVNGKDNKPFKTRSGGAFKLDDLINEVKETFISLREENKNMDNEDLDKIVNSIIKFADLQNDLERNYIFDIQKFSEVNGKTGPYILYTYLRINKLLTSKGKLSNKIYNEKDKNLRMKILEVTNALNTSIKELKPHYIANYLYELSVAANDFYETNHLNKLTGEEKEDYLYILNLNNRIIKILLNILGIYIPTKM